jgi:LuxR family maltose regulon positive regulatory protein
VRRHGEGTQLADRAFQIPDFAIDRPALLARLDEGMGGKVTALVAPPGFGKSLLLQQWIRARDHLPLAWVSLDGRDDYGPRLASRLVGAFGAIDPDIGSSALERVDATGRAMGDRFIAHLLSDLEMVGACTLVVDGIDALSNRRVVQDLRALVDHSSTDFNLIVATRGDDLVQLGSGPQTTELGRTELAFTRDDTALLVERLTGRAFSDRQIDDLQTKTEGWPAAVQLAALALRDDPDADGFIDRLSGDDQFISGYLTDEVLARQTDEIVRFLAQTSVLSSLSAPLCDAITGRDDSAELLDQLDRKSMFLVPAGTDGKFRYHRLFRDLTRRELSRTEPEGERRLLRSAADWHLTRGEFDVAASYFIEAEDWEQVLDLVTTHGRAMFERNEPALVLRWIQAVPIHIRHRRSTTLLEEIALEGIVGHTVQAEELAGRLERSGRLTAGEQVTLHAARTAWVQWHATPRSVIVAADDALAALEHVPEAEVPNILGISSAVHVREIVLANRARALWYLGDADRARRDLVELAEGDMSFAPWLINVLGAAALIDAWAGRLHEAYQGALRALLVASRADLLGHHATVDAHLAMAEVLRERDSLARAELALEEAFGPMERVQRSASLAIHTAFRALVDLAHGEPAQGVDRIARFLSSGHGSPPPIIAARLGAIDTRLRLALGDLAAADRLLEGIEHLWTTDHASAVAQVATSRNELDAARMLLSSWPQDDLRSRLDLLIWTAIVDELDGDHRAARLGLAEAVALAEPQGHVRVFVEAGPDAHRVLHRLFDAAPTTYLRRLVDACDRPTTPTGPDQNGAGLSPRELLVLGYLPTRLSNAEIAEVLYVSLNTIKTHLRKIYQRLGVSGRRQAVEAAERLGLL